MAEKTDGGQTVREMIGGIAPKLTEITEQVVYGDVGQRPGLTPRDRSLITVAALMAMNRTEQLPFHLRLAIDHGVTQEELVETITHLAFYSGWPTAMSAMLILKEILSSSGEAP